MYVQLQIILSSVKVAESPPFENELPSVMCLCYLILPILGFKDRILVLIVPVGGHCLLSTLQTR